MADPGQRIRAGCYVRMLRENRNVRLLWFAQIVSELGDWLYAVVIYDLLLRRTGNAQSVAFAVIAQVLPQVVAAPMAGTLNDRLPRRWVMIWSDIFRVAIVLGMLVAARGETAWLIYVLLFAETTLWGFFEPGRNALLPNLARDARETLIANSLSTATWSFNLVAGSALGGFLAVAVGADAVFLINAASFVVSAACLLAIEAVEPHTAEQPPLRARDLVDFSPVLEGYRYVRRDRRTMALLWAKAGLGLMGSNYVILSLFGERVFPVDRKPILGMSVLMAARGLGALLGPAVAGWWASGREKAMLRGIFVGFLLGAAGYLLLGFAPGIGSAVAFVILAHAGGSTIWVFETTMLQSQTEDRFRGRVFSADLCFLVIAMACSVFASSFLVDRGMGVREASMALGAVLLIPALLWLAWGLPSWRHDGDAGETLPAGGRN